MGFGWGKQRNNVTSRSEIGIIHERKIANGATKCPSTVDGKYHSRSVLECIGRCKLWSMALRVGLWALAEKFTTQLFYAQSISVNLLVNFTSAGVGDRVRVRNRAGIGIG